MSYFTLGHHLPKHLSALLFGNRELYGVEKQPHDPDWEQWNRIYWDFNFGNQRRSVGRIVNDAGYAVINRFDLDGKRVLEMGPGNINHQAIWRGKPSTYVLADIREDALDLACSRLRERDIPYEPHLLPQGSTGDLPFQEGEFDLVFSFYSLEHLYPLCNYLQDLSRVLKRGGCLVGAIPCEGGIAWGTGRLLTSYRWMKKNTAINYSKVICWEHPNFAEDIFLALDRVLVKKHLAFWPLPFLPCIDSNLVAKFVYEKY